MTVPCVHWRSCGLPGGGACTHARAPHGKTVSVGVCLRVCTDYEGPSRGAGDQLAELIQRAKLRPREKCILCRAIERVLNIVAPTRVRKGR